MDGQAVEPITEAPRARRFPLPSRGGEIAALEFGPADRPLDILFCHANGFNALTYRSILAPLEGLRVLAIDLRGHGATTLPTPIEDRDGWKIYRDDILALLPFVAEAPVVMAGHSMGGAARLLAAAAAPEKVRSLVLFDPVLMPDALSVAAAPSAVAQSPMVQGALRRRATFADKAAAFAAYRGRGAFATWSEAQLADYVEAGFVATDDGQVTLACAPAWEASNFASSPTSPPAAGCGWRRWPGPATSCPWSGPTSCARRSGRRPRSRAGLTPAQAAGAAPRRQSTDSSFSRKAKRCRWLATTPSRRARASSPSVSTTSSRASGRARSLASPISKRMRPSWSSNRVSTLWPKCLQSWIM